MHFVLTSAGLEKAFERVWRRLLSGVLLFSVSFREKNKRKKKEKKKEKLAVCVFVLFYSLVTK